MDKIGFVTLFQDENRVIKDTAILEDSQKIAGFRYFEGEIGGRDIVFTSPDPDRTSLACCIQTMIEKFRPSLILFSGLARTIVPFIETGDLIVASYIVSPEMPESPFIQKNREFNQMIDIDGNILSILRTAARAIENSGPQTVFGSIIEASHEAVSRPRLRNTCKRMGIMAADHLAGTAARVCRHNNIPIAVIECAAADNSDIENFPTSSKYEDTINKLFNFKLVTLTELSRSRSSSLK